MKKNKNKNTDHVEFDITVKLIRYALCQASPPAAHCIKLFAIENSGKSHKLWQRAIFAKDYYTGINSGNNFAIVFLWQKVLCNGPMVTLKYTYDIYIET